MSQLIIDARGREIREGAVVFLVPSGSPVTVQGIPDVLPDEDDVLGDVVVSGPDSGISGRRVEHWLPVFNRRGEFVCYDLTVEVDRV